MRRREFIVGLGGAAVAWPLASRAQQRGGSVPKVGFLMGIAENSPDGARRIAAFRRGMAELGWKEGDNVHIEYRWAAGDIELIQRHAQELVALAPNVILANSTPAIEALKKNTSSIPIVCALVIDPVGLGFVKSLSRPGGNITGFTFIDPELIGKWVGLLRDVAPGFTQASVLYNAKTTPFYRDFVRDAARQWGATDLSEALVTTADEIDAVISALAAKPGSGLIIGPDPFTSLYLKQIAQLAAQKRLPTVSVHRQFVVQGGLMAYGPDTADIFRRSAVYIDRILKGANPADLPVQQPTKFELTINRKTASALDIEVPARLLFTADEVIE
jgi:putative tryptophan/tyrosine transport system substrate-binding protein